MSSPYEGHSETQWADITRKLVADYPLGVNDIVDAVLAAWDGILKSNIAGELQIGVDIFPSPQSRLFFPFACSYCPYFVRN